MELIAGSVIGHRGAAAVAPENTLAGLKAAKAAGIHWVEFDVMLTKDGVAILHHDETLDRTTNGSGAVAETDWGVISKLDASHKFGPDHSGEGVPKFSDAIQMLAELGLSANVEIKPTEGREVETAKAVCKLIGDYWPGNIAPAILSSFSETALATVHDVAPEFHRALLVGRIPDDWRARMTCFGCMDLHASEGNHDAKIREVALTETPLRLYTVNNPDRARELFNLGAGAIFTDDPGLMVGAL